MWQLARIPCAPVLQSRENPRSVIILNAVGHRAPTPWKRRLTQPTAPPLWSGGSHHRQHRREIAAEDALLLELLDELRIVTADPRGFGLVCGKMDGARLGCLSTPVVVVRARCAALVLSRDQRVSSSWIRRGSMIRKAPLTGGLLARSREPYRQRKRNHTIWVQNTGREFPSEQNPTRSQPSTERFTDVKLQLLLLLGTKGTEGTSGLRTHR